MMQYQSIIRILKHCDIDCRFPDVARAKRILAAEFSIAPRGIISIDGFDYTKNDVFNELEHTDFVRRLSIHVLIWRTPILLNFLEKNEIAYTQIINLEQLSHNWRRRQVFDFISPYFAVSFAKAMRRLLNEAQFMEANAWLETLYITNNKEDRRTALSSTKEYLTDFIKLLRNSNDVTYKNHLPQLEKFFSQPWRRFVNNLPCSLSGITYNLLLAMHNFTLIIKHIDSDLCLKMSRQMIEVRNIDDELRERIAREHELLALSKDYSHT